MNFTSLKHFSLMAGLFLLLVSFPVQAGYDYKFDKRINPMGNFESEMASKLTRGAVNVFFGWTELVKTPIDMSQGPKKNIFKTVFVGIPYGVIRAVGRTGVGLFEIVTFYAPQKPIFPPIEGDID